MNRRGFLGGILAAGVAPAFVGSQILMPVKKLFAPEPYIITRGNTLLTIDMVTQEALRILHENIEFERAMNYEWPKNKFDRVHIRLPQRFVAT